MQLGQSSKNYVKAFFAFAAVGLISACSDNSSVAPEAAPVTASAPANFGKAEGVKVIVVDNNKGGTFRVGRHVLHFPAGSICSLTSSYGATEWDKPCAKANGLVVITASMWKDGDNHPYVDFQPAMRFAPNKEVMLFLRNGLARQAAELQIEYCNNLGHCVDESLNDASLAPFRVGKTSVLGRRIKHFSGYSVTAGRGCAGSLSEEGDSWVCNNETMARKSGYMVASGFKDDGRDKKDKDQDQQ